MRILTLPVSLLLAFFLYSLCPQAAGFLSSLLQRLYARLLTRFTRRDGRTDDAPALACFLLLTAAAASLPGAVHPLAAAVVMTPLFAAFALLPSGAQIKQELDSGTYARDIPAYESLVRDSCAAFAPAFVQDACAPLLLCALGMPLHLSCALGWAYFALRALCDTQPLARRILALILRPANAVMHALLVLCAGVAGRSPLRTRGATVQARLMSTLGIAGDETDTHAPMAGDISQAAFLCCFVIFLLCVMLCIVFFALC